MVAQLGLASWVGRRKSGWVGPTCQRQRREKAQRVKGTCQKRKHLLENVPKDFGLTGTSDEVAAGKGGAG
jgi:hypothetical protein